MNILKTLHICSILSYTKYYFYQLQPNMIISKLQNQFQACYFKIHKTTISNSRNTNLTKEV